MKEDTVNTISETQYAFAAETPERSAEEVLREIYVLLEEYGPAWYTEELSLRARDALQLWQR